MFYVPSAQAQIGKLRKRVSEMGFSWPVGGRLDLELLATVFLDCQVIELDQLTDRAALRYLAKHCGIEPAGIHSHDTPLAAGLYCSRRTNRRWLFVEKADVTVRQRFSIAHEIGHLVLEFENTITGAAPVSHDPQHALVSFTRCTSKELEKLERGPRLHVVKDRGSRRWSPEELREFDANHFAAELLMPCEAVRAIIRTETPTGVNSDDDLKRVVSAVRSTFDVSLDAAQRRVRHDLRVRPASSDPNEDLFVQP